MNIKDEIINETIGKWSDNPVAEFCGRLEALGISDDVLRNEEFHTALVCYTAVIQSKSYAMLMEEMVKLKGESK